MASHPEPTAPPPPAQPSRARRGGGLLAARIGAALALAIATAAVLLPFLNPMAWAGIVAYTTWPIFRRVRAHTQRPRLAAALFTLAVAIVVGVPIGLLLAALADDATNLVRSFRAWREDGAVLPPGLLELPWVQRGLEWMRELPVADPQQASEWIGRAGTEVSRQLVALAGGIARNAFRFGVMLLSLFAFYVSGEELIAQGRRLAPLLFPAAPERFLERIGDSIRAVVFGLLGTAAVQGLLAGLGLAVAGVPNPVALGTATAVLSFLPGGGGAITLISAAWLAFGGHWVPAIGLAIWSVVVVSSVDNVLRPVLISGAGRIPFLLVFFGVLGGLSTFGLIGVFLGPVLLSVSFTLLLEFARGGPEPSASAEAAPAREAPEG